MNDYFSDIKLPVSDFWTTLLYKYYGEYVEGYDKTDGKLVTVGAYFWNGCYYIDKIVSVKKLNRDQENVG